MKSVPLTTKSLNLSIPISFFPSSSPKNHNSPYISTARCLRKSNLTNLVSTKSRFIKINASNSTKSPATVTTRTEIDSNAVESSIGTTLVEDQWNVQVGSPSLPPLHLSLGGKLSLGDQAFVLLSFIACLTSIGFTSFVIAAVPTLNAMGRVAISLSKLADTARTELPSTMTAIRLSGMEISDLTLELSDLSHEIAGGISDSSQAVQAADAGIKKIGSHAHQQTISIIEERARLPIISLQTFVMGAAKKTSHVVGRSTKSFMNIISQGDLRLKHEKTNGIDRLEVRGHGKSNGSSHPS